MASVTHVGWMFQSDDGNVTLHQSWNVTPTSRIVVLL